MFDLGQILILLFYLFSLQTGRTKIVLCIHDRKRFIVVILFSLVATILTLKKVVAIIGLHFHQFGRIFVRL